MTYDPKNEECPVCGYYCLGKGGFGCIDKPSLVNKEASPETKLTAARAVIEEAEKALDSPYLVMSGAWQVHRDNALARIREWKETGK